MKLKITILIFGIIILFITGCNKEWDNYYNTFPETVDQNVWDAMQNDPQISQFVQIIKESKIDSLFEADIPYTIFAPTNEALSGYVNTKEFTDVIIRYHIATHYINTSNINGKRQIQTLTEKFALFEKDGSTIKIDNIEINSQSPLYRNGRYFVMDEVVEPNPNLYEYYDFTNPILADYIDDQDTIILDREKSKPLGFDENGNTVYDTVSTVENVFEWEYFPVKHEFRTISATLVFPKEEDYYAALDLVAQSLGGSYNDHSDIPLGWQNEVLIPHLLYQGVFLNRLEKEEFVWSSPTDTVKLLNMLGDSVVITYVPTDQALCSNGYAYNYENFEIPDSLYQGGTKMEAEELLDQTGLNKFSWFEYVTAKSTIPLNPVKELIKTASNDSILRVMLPKGYSDEFSLEFPGPNIFPRKYLLVIRTHMDVGGIFDIYVNDELVKTFNYYEFLRYQGLMFSVDGKTRYIPTGRFNSFDMWVENITEYGKPKIRIEYKSPSTNVLSNGLVIDYIEFVPVEE